MVASKSSLVSEDEVTVPRYLVTRARDFAELSLREIARRFIEPVFLILRVWPGDSGDMRLAGAGAAAEAKRELQEVKNGTSKRMRSGFIMLQKQH